MAPRAREGADAGRIIVRHAPHGANHADRSRTLRRAMRRALGTSLKVAAAAADRIRPPGRGVTILLYHRVGATTGSEVDLAREVFDDQMAWLVATRRVVRLGDALAELSSATPPADDPVVVTFDDGTADIVEHALPILVRHRVPMTLYVSTHFIDSGEAFPWGAPPLSWRSLEEATATGLVDVGSHTHSHALLDRSRDVAAELDRSIALVQDRLGVRPLDFAYPKAVLGSPAAERLVRQRFRSAALAGTEPNGYGRTDAHRLARSPIQRSDGVRYFRRKAEGGLRLEDAARSRLDRWRYRGRTT